MVNLTANRLSLRLLLVAVLTPGIPAAALGTWRARVPPGRKSLKELSASYGFPRPRPVKDTLTLKSKYTEIVFHADGRRILFNNILVWMNAGSEAAGGEWHVATIDADTVLAPLLRSSDLPAIDPARTVVIDPGHGGDDTGAMAPGKLLEKQLVLDVAARTLAALRNAGNVKTRLTRTADTTLSLAQRTELAGKWDAALFVSIHMNSAPNKAACGIETYVLPAPGFPSTSGNDKRTEAAPGNRHDAANSFLAYCVHRQLLKQSGAPDRGIRRARFDVIRDAPCPAVLIECGFLSHSAERSRLASTDYRQMLAKAIADGIRDFLAKTGPTAKDSTEH